MSFGAPLYLWGLLLASLPIIIHLLNRRRLPRLSFSSLRFLAGVRRDRMRWLRLRELLLLLARTLLIALLFLGLARPYSASRPIPTRRQASLAILIDDSYSLSYGRDTTVFDRALKAARELFGGLSAGSEVAIIQASNPHSKLSPDLNWANSMLSILSCSFNGVDLGPGLTEASRLIEQARLPQKEIWVLTDLQRRALLPLLDLKPSPIPCYILDLGIENPQNCGISGLRTEPLLHGTQGWAEAKLKNYGSNGVRTTVALNNHAEQAIELEPGEERWVRLEPLRAETLWAEISQDELAVDDRRCAVAQAQKPVRVLLVSENPDDSYYLSRALVPGSGQGFEVWECTPKELGQKDLSSFSVVGLIGLQGLSRPQIKRIEHYLKGEGGIFIVLKGPLKDPEWLEPYCTVETTPGLPEGSFLTLSELDYSHPILYPFKDQCDLTLPRFFKRLKVRPNSSKVLARFSDGTPWLLAWDRGVLLTSGLDLNCTDLPVKAIFPPLMHRAFRYLDQEPDKEWIVGDTITIKVDGSSPVRVLGPDNLEFRVLPQLIDGRKILKFVAKAPGFYRIGDQIVAVNLDPDEGDLTRMRRGELESLGFKVFSSPQLQGFDFSPIFLFAALACMIIELILILI
jgi:hypothetical protein